MFSHTQVAVLLQTCLSEVAQTFEVSPVIADAPLLLPGRPRQAPAAVWPLMRGGRGQGAGHLRGLSSEPVPLE
jgi:hypothetical protein